MQKQIFTNRLRPEKSLATEGVFFFLCHNQRIFVKSYLYVCFIV